MLVNLTPHPITLRIGEREIVLPASGVVLQARQKEETVGRIVVDGLEIDVLRVEYGDPEPPLESLPGWEEGARYVVSSLAAQAVARRYPEHSERFLVPARPVRDEQGRIIAAQALAVI